MAKIIIDNQEKELANGSKIRETCEILGVPFACRAGVCGACKIDILEGAENLTELTQEEIDLGRDKNHRLACQVTIISGTIKIRGL
jgi:ferredoxin